MKIKLYISILILFFIQWKIHGQSDNCATATVVNLVNGASCVNGTTVNATSANTLYGGCNTTPVNEVWYTFVTTGSQNDFSIISQGITNSEIVVYTGGCGGTLNICNTATGTNPLNMSWGFPIGTQVWIGIASNGGNQGAFEFCVNSYTASTANGNGCSGAIPLCDKNATTNINIPP